VSCELCASGTGVAITFTREFRLHVPGSSVHVDREDAELLVSRGMAVYGHHEMHGPAEPTKAELVALGVRKLGLDHQAAECMTKRELRQRLVEASR
jgi:hypothetical protein